MTYPLNRLSLMAASAILALVAGRSIALPMAGADGSLASATQPALSSEPVEKDGLQVRATLPKATFAINEPLKFTVQFKNVSEKPFMLHDADYFWDWRITFENQRKIGPWRLEGLFDVDRKSVPKTLKPGEEIMVPVSLEQANGKRVLPFQYVWEGAQRKSVAPIGILPPERYQVVIEVTREGLVMNGRWEFPFWTGTIRSEPVEFTITDKPAATQATVKLGKLVGKPITLTRNHGGPAEFAAGEPQ